MPSVWDHRADKDLLLVIISGNNLKSIEWPSVREKLAEKGYTFTKEACRQHFQKIRKEARRSSASPSEPATPAKKPRNSSAANTPASKRKTTVVDSDGNDKEDLSPTKRVRKEEHGKNGTNGINDNHAKGGMNGQMRFKLEEVGSEGQIIIDDDDDDDETIYDQ